MEDGSVEEGVMEVGVYKGKFLLKHTKSFSAVAYIGGI